MWCARSRPVCWRGTRSQKLRAASKPIVSRLEPGVPRINKADIRWARGAGPAARVRGPRFAARVGVRAADGRRSRRTRAEWDATRADNVAVPLYNAGRKRGFSFVRVVGANKTRSDTDVLFATYPRTARSVRRIAHCAVDTVLMSVSVIALDLPPK